MRKSILTAVALGALAFGGAASAQSLGSVIGDAIHDIFGIGQPSPNSTYVDQYGRRVYVDAYGRHIVQPSPNVYGGVAYDAWGRPVYTAPAGNYAYSAPTWDYDGDGIANSRDRWPDNSRYW